MRARRKAARRGPGGDGLLSLRVGVRSAAAFGYGFTSMEASYDEQQRVNRALGELRAGPRWLISSVSLDASELARIEGECAAGREAGQLVFDRRVASITKMPSADEFDT